MNSDSSSLAVEDGDDFAPSPLQDLVEQECGFLRVRRCVLHQVRAYIEWRRDPLPRVVTHCLRVFIHNLPVVKRANWQVPLVYAVLGVLKRAGCRAFAKRGGELFAPLQGVKGGTLVRVEFVAVTTSRAVIGEVMQGRRGRLRHLYSGVALPVNILTMTQEHSCSMLCQ